MEHVGTLFKDIVNGILTRKQGILTPREGGINSNSQALVLRSVVTFIVEGQLVYCPNFLALDSWV